ncbi:SRPBCC domain-containing protein [Flavobacterium procerum]|uniref:SRPBCC domain-containing protein n=1 Tax=Flavobacterium procerum TaxID=1455569 RepID=A0ABV6BU73_9FLAO
MMITVKTFIDVPKEKAWEFWTLPEHIVKWNHPSEDWHTVAVENDLRIGGKFKYVMKTKDESQGFDFEGVYTDVKIFSLIEYKLSDNRTGSIHFNENNDSVMLIEMFEPEGAIPENIQRQWCQAVIDNFKSYVEADENN